MTGSALAAVPTELAVWTGDGGKAVVDTGCHQDRYASVIVVRDLDGLRLLDSWLTDRATTALGIDSETNAVSPWDRDFVLRTVQLADEHEAWVVVVEQLNVFERLRFTELVHRHRFWVGHYSRSEINFMGRGLPGCWRFEEDAPHIADLQVLLGYYDPRTLMPPAKDGIDPRLAHKRGLKETSTRELSPVLADVEKLMHQRFRALAPVGHRTPKKSVTWGFANVPNDDPVYLVYGALDPLMTIRLWNRMLPVVRQTGQWDSVVREDIHTQWDADKGMFRGLPVDATYVRWLSGELSHLITYYARFLAGYGINDTGMGPAVGVAFGALGVTSPKTTKGGALSWDKEVVAELAAGDGPVAELAKAIKAVRQATKFAAAYVQPMLDALTRDGRVHCDLRVIGTVTGRWSARDPALQQLPKKDVRVRAAYTALPGHVLVSCDLSQGEPRTMAALSGDRNLLAAIMSADLNSALAQATFGDAFAWADGKVAGTVSYPMRQKAKVAFLAKCYGASIKRIAASLGVSYGEAQVINARWEREYPDLWAYARELNQEAAVVLESGRVCPLWDRFTVDNAGGLRVYPKPSRKGLNYKTQGTQRDLLNRAWRLLVSWGWGWAFYFAVHDELILSVPPFMADDAAAALKAAMTSNFNGVPIECEAEINGRTWLPQPTEFDAREIQVVDMEDMEIAA